MYELMYSRDAQPTSFFQPKGINPGVMTKKGRHNFLPGESENFRKSPGRTKKFLTLDSRPSQISNQIDAADPAPEKWSIRPLKTVEARVTFKTISQYCRVTLWNKRLFQKTFSMSGVKEDLVNGVLIEPETLGPSLESIPVPESFQRRLSGTENINSTEFNSDKGRTNERNRKSGSRSRTPSNETWDRRNRK